LCKNRLPLSPKAKDENFYARKKLFGSAERDIFGSAECDISASRMRYVGFANAICRLLPT